MRILYVCSDSGVHPTGTNGSAAHLRHITKGLAEIGHEVLLLSRNAGPRPPHPTRSVLPPGNPIEDGLKPLKRWMATSGLGDGLHRDLKKLSYNAWAVEECHAALAGDPPDVIIERLSLFSRVGLELAERFCVPLIVEVNAILTEEDKSYRTLHLSDLAQTIERDVLSKAAAIVTVSESLGAALVGRGIDKAMIHCVPNGADLSMFDGSIIRDEARKGLGLGGDELVIGFVGSLKPWHGVETLLDAVTACQGDLPDWRLLIVGSGPEEDRLKARASAAGLGPRCLFTGSVTHDRIPAMLRSMDLAVAPYPAIENFYFSPVKLFEYMAAGLCVVAPRLGQIPQIVEHGRTGLLYNPKSPGEFQLRLVEAAVSPRRRNELGMAARDEIERRWTWRHTAQRLTAIIERLPPTSSSDPRLMSAAGAPS